MIGERQQLYYTPHEMAEVLRVSAMTIRRMIARGELCAVQVGPARLRIPSSELDRINRTGTTAPSPKTRKKSSA